MREGFKAGLKMIFIVSIPFIVVYFGFSSAAMKFFLSSKEDISAVLKEGTLFLRIVSPFYLVISVKLMADGVLRGAGAMKSFMVATFSDLILRVLLSYVLAKGLGMGSVGIWLSWPIGWVIGTALSAGYYKAGVWVPKDPDA